MVGCEDNNEIQGIMRTRWGKIFIDVGANDGYYVKLLNRHFKKIYAIEPFSSSVNRIKGLVKHQKLRNVEILPFAISNRSGKIRFYLSGRGPRCHSLQKVGERSLTVECFTLNQLFLNQKIDLIKVDVEGSEFEVLLGADMIMENVKAWMIELHDLGEITIRKRMPRDEYLARVKEMDDLLKRWGYETKWIKNRWVFAERK